MTKESLANSLIEAAARVEQLPKWAIELNAAMDRASSAKEEAAARQTPGAALRDEGDQRR